MGSKRAAPWRSWLPLALILLAGAILQLPALRAPFFADDYLFLDQVRGRSLLAALTSPDPLGNFARPVGRQLHFWWLARLSGESPLAFHAANLALFLIALGLLFLLTRRLAGTRAAAVAAAIVGLHYAADVPLRWASGSQDLLALVGALAGFLLFVSGFRWAAALALFLAMLSKETVLLSPLIAAYAACRPGEPWEASARRAWPLAAPVVAWAALWNATGGLRGGPGALTWDASAPVAAMAHLAHVFAGIEWGTGSISAMLRLTPSVVPLGLVALAVWLAVGGEARSHGEEARAVPDTTPLPRRDARERRRPRSRYAVRLGLAWAILGALPVAAVAATWSAYYYLFAVCGLALALGAMTTHWPRAAVLLLVVALARGSENGRRLEEFATARGAWTVQSHVNRFYLDRAMALSDRYLGELRAARPTLAPRSTLFFSGLRAFAGFQAADGPLVRWAYRDSSLRSYFQGAFSLEKAQRGPMFFFETKNDTLKERPGDNEFFSYLAHGMILRDALGPAHDALALVLARDPSDRRSSYWLAWVEWGRGNRELALRRLARAGASAIAGPTPEISMAADRLASGDTLGATHLAIDAAERHALDPATHAFLADLLLGSSRPPARAGIEAFAARVLEPDDPASWRRWAMAQVAVEYYPHATESLEHYLALGGPAARADAEAVSLLAQLRRAGPGGDLAQRELKSSNQAR